MSYHGKVDIRDMASKQRGFWIARKTVAKD